MKKALLVISAFLLAVSMAVSQDANQAPSVQHSETWLNMDGGKLTLPQPINITKGDWVQVWVVCHLDAPVTCLAAAPYEQVSKTSFTLLKSLPLTNGWQEQVYSWVAPSDIPSARFDWADEVVGRDEEYSVGFEHRKGLGQ